MGEVASRVAEHLDRLVFWAALLVMALYLVRLGIVVIRAQRAGWSGVAIWSWVTVSLIRFGCALAGAVAGSRLVSALLPQGTAQAAGTLFQVAGALILSDVVDRGFSRWLARPIGLWFNPEEAKQHDG